MLDGSGLWRYIWVAEVAEAWFRCIGRGVRVVVGFGRCPQMSCRYIVRIGDTTNIHSAFSTSGIAFWVCC